MSKRDSLTALDVAIRMQDSLSVKSLLDTKQIHDIDKYIILACSQQNVSIVKLLIENGANPNYSLDNNYSSLMAAASFGSKEVLIQLIQYNININQQRKTDGVTALMLAALNHDLEMVKCLLLYGAGKNIRDLNGNRAVDYIMKNKNTHQSQTDLDKMINLLK